MLVWLCHWPWNRIFLTFFCE